MDFLDQAPAPLCRDGRQDGGDVVDLRLLRKSRHVVRDHRGFVAVDARELEGLVVDQQQTLLSGVSSAVSPLCVFLSMWDSSPVSDTSHGPN